MSGTDEIVMNIIGPDTLVFGVDDVAACTQYLTDYGLEPIGVSIAGGCFEAMDGTAIVILHKDDADADVLASKARILRKLASKRITTVDNVMTAT